MDIKPLLVTLARYGWHELYQKTLDLKIDKAPERSGVMIGPTNLSRKKLQMESVRMGDSLMNSAKEKVQLD